MMAEYIERESLIREIISNMASFIGTPDEVQKHDEQCNYATSCIEDALAVDVTPVVHERFIETERSIRDGKSKVYGWECAVCKRFTRSPFVDNWKFCPNCGSKMDGGNSDE